MVFSQSPAHTDSESKFVIYGFFSANLRITEGEQKNNLQYLDESQNVWHCKGL